MTEETEGKKIKNPQGGEIVIVDRDAAVNNYMGMNYSNRINPNDFFNGNGNTADMQEIVREMEAGDPMLPGIFTVVRSVLGYKRRIDGEGRYAEMIREQFAEIKNFRAILDHLLDAKKYGFAPIEFVWTNKGGVNWWKKIHDWSPGRFLFSKDNYLMLQLDDGTEKRMNEEYKFLVYVNEMKYGCRYGTSDYHKLYWYSMFNRNTFFNWDSLLKTHAKPWPIISPESADAAERWTTDDHEAAKSFIENLEGAAGAIFDTPTRATFMEAARSSGGDFEKFVLYLNRVKSMLLTGTPETAEIITSSYAAEKERAYLRQDVEQKIINDLETFVNDEMIDMWFRYNYPSVPASERPKWRIEKPKDTKDKKEYIESTIAAVNAGVPVTVRQVQEKMGFDIPQGGEPILQRGTPTGEQVATFARQKFEEEARLWKEDKASFSKAK